LHENADQSTPQLTLPLPADVSICHLNFVTCSHLT